jgi:hypothetical protein
MNRSEEIGIPRNSCPTTCQLLSAAGLCPGMRVAEIGCGIVLAHLGVARADALQSMTSRGVDADAARIRALAAYKDFLTLWKDADPGIPILKEAKAEYAKLQ